MLASLEGVEWTAQCPGRTLSPGKSRYPFYRRLCGHQGRSGQVQKISSPSEFDPGPSSYTDCATRPTHTHTHTHIYVYKHPCRWTAVSSRDWWQSYQSVCSCLSTVSNCRVDAIYLVIQRNDAASACALFHVSDHLHVSIMAGIYKKAF